MCGVEAKVGCVCVTLTWSSFLTQNFIEKPSRAVSDLYAAEIIHFKAIQVRTNYRSPVVSPLLS